MLRPVEASLTLYNVEHKASQLKDPNAPQYQALQQDEIAKNAQQKAQTVQPSPKTEGGVKIREDKERDRRNGGNGSSRKDASGKEADDDHEKNEKYKNPHGGLNLFA